MKPTSNGVLGTQLETVRVKPARYIGIGHIVIPYRSRGVRGELMTEPFLMLTAEQLRRLNLLGVPHLSQSLYLYMRIRAGKSGLFWEAKAKTALVFGKAGLSEKARRDWFTRTVDPLIAKSLIERHRRGRTGLTAEYRVLDILEFTDPMFDVEPTNHARDWAVESALDVDPDLAEVLWGMYDCHMSKARFMRELQILSDYPDQRLAVYGSAEYWKRQNLPFNGLAEEAMIWGVGPFAY